MELDRDLIERSLKIRDFNIEEICIDKIQHVPTHEWKIATSDKSLLYIENLQCCVGLYAYGNNFAFAAHINTVVFDKEEYMVDENKTPVCCTRCYDLLKEILKYKGEINEPFKVGISLGTNPLDDNEKSMLLIYEGINEVIKKLTQLGIPVIQLENICKPELIIDASNNSIITPIKSKIVR